MDTSKNSPDSTVRDPDEPEVKEEVLQQALERGANISLPALDVAPGSEDTSADDIRVEEVKRSLADKKGKARMEPPPRSETGSDIAVGFMHEDIKKLQDAISKAQTLLDTLLTQTSNLQTEHAKLNSLTSKQYQEIINRIARLERPGLANEGNTAAVIPTDMRAAPSEVAAQAPVAGPSNAPGTSSAVLPKASSVVSRRARVQRY